MKRTTTATIVGGIAGSAVILGVALAGPASAFVGGHATGSEHRPFDCGRDQRQGQAGDQQQQAETKGHHRSRHHARRCRGQRPSPAPTGSATETPPPSESQPPSTTATPTGSATATPTGSATATPTGSATAACSTQAGAATTVASPGIGNVTVTIKVCGGALDSASAAISQSNWEPQNTNAFTALNQLAVQYYKTDMSKITFSGATLTSNAYRTSLQSALTKAGL